MSIPNFDELLAQFPPITPHRLCNPLYCKNNNMKTPSPESLLELESVLLKLLQEGRILSIAIMLFGEGSKNTVGGSKLFKPFFELLVNSSVLDINSLENLEVLQKFRADFKKAVETEVDSWMRYDTMIAIGFCGFISSIEKNLGKEICVCSSVEPDNFKRIQEFYSVTSTNPGFVAQNLIMVMNKFPELKYYELPNLFRTTPATPQKNMNFLYDIGAIILAIFEDSLSSHELDKYFKVTDRLLGGIEAFNYGKLISSSKNARGDIEPDRIEFNMASILPHLSDKDPASSLASWLESLKRQADEKVKEDDYKSAIAIYNTINSLPTVNDSIKVQSLANTALLRLRLAPTQPQHLPYAIYECTIALEIDPNHGKALFRRGLALALMKKWNEAIVDFQRAVEVDPRSPAAAELVVALREVWQKNWSLRDFH